MSNLLRERILELVERHGSYRAAGYALGIEHSHLWRMARGEKEPTAATARKLGLIKAVSYKSIPTKATDLRAPMSLGGRVVVRAALEGGDE